jgi:hypothetical protein
MNELAQAAVITAIRDRPAKGTVDTATNWTSPQSIVVHLRIRREHSLPANRTDLATDRVDSGQAVAANGQPGNIQEGLAADAAVGGKQNREETLSSVG